MVCIMNEEEGQTPHFGLPPKPPDTRGEDIRELVELRTRGVEMRNRGAGLRSAGEIQDWIQEAEEWGSKAAAAAFKISLADGEFVRTLNRMPAVDFVGVEDPNHQRVLRVVEEKLRRIEGVLERFRRGS